MPGSPAERAGLAAGDRILAVEGVPVEWWDDLAEGLGRSGAGTLTLEVERRGERTRRSIEIDKKGAAPDQVGLHRGGPAAVVAVASADSPAAQAGLRTGDLVQRVGGREVPSWYDLVSALEEERGRVEIEVLRSPSEGAPETLRLVLALGEGPDPIGRLGIFPGDLSVQQVDPDSPASRAGLRSGDLLLAIDGERLRTFRGLAERIRRSEGRAVTLEILRDGERLALDVVPERRDVVELGVKERVYAIGMRGGTSASPELRSRRTSNPVVALAMGVEWTGEIIVRTFEGIGMLVTGRVGREGLAGPIGIGVIAAQSFQAGWVQGILMMAVISVNLAILNLLPVPVLDGGQIAFALAEWLKGGPVPFRIREVAQQVGLAILLCLMVFAFWNDLARHWSDIVSFFQGTP
jgi:regulator of sigma E protease